MDNVHLLIANSEQGLGNLIESQVLDACLDRAVVETTRIGLADEVVELTSSGWYQLIIVAADNLLPGPGFCNSRVSAEEAARAIREIRGHCDTPVIALAAFPTDEALLLEAGAECVVRLPLDNEKLKVEVRRALKVAEPLEGSEHRRPSSNEPVKSGFGAALAHAIRSSGRSYN